MHEPKHPGPIGRGPVLGDGGYIIEWNAGDTERPEPSRPTSSWTTPRPSGSSTSSFSTPAPRCCRSWPSTAATRSWPRWAGTTRPWRSTGKPPKSVVKWRETRRWWRGTSAPPGNGRRAKHPGLHHRLAAGPVPAMGLLSRWRRRLHHRVGTHAGIRGDAGGHRRLPGGPARGLRLHGPDPLVHRQSGLSRPA